MSKALVSIGDCVPDDRSAISMSKSEWLSCGITMASDP